MSNVRCAVKSFAIGEDGHESMRCTVLGYERAPSGDYYDDNWLNCRLEVKAGAFRGDFSTSLLTSELLGIQAGLGKLHRDLSGSYTFEAMEGQLVLNASCDRIGHIQISCEVWDQPGIGNRLSFGIFIDQTFLASTLQQLADVVHAFPVRT
jgi:hypothetical protein